MLVRDRNRRNAIAMEFACCYFLGHPIGNLAAPAFRVAGNPLQLQLVPPPRDALAQFPALGLDGLSNTILSLPVSIWCSQSCSRRSPNRMRLLGRWRIIPRRTPLCPEMASLPGPFGRRVGIPRGWCGLDSKALVGNRQGVDLNRARPATKTQGVPKIDWSLALLVAAGEDYSGFLPPPPALLPGAEKKWRSPCWRDTYADKLSRSQNAFAGFFCIRSWWAAILVVGWVSAGDVAGCATWR